MNTLFLVIMTLASSVYAADDCSFNFLDFHSPLDADAKSKIFKSIKAEDKDKTKRLVTQEAQLKSGELVKFSGGGCAHFGYTFTYASLKKKPSIQYAIELLEKTPTTPKALAQKEILIRALKKREIPMGGIFETKTYELPCGDAQCDLDLSNPKILSISYSFAL